MIKQAIIFIGIQASGKTTFYNKYFGNYLHINLDTLHTRNKEFKMLDECIEQGQSFVVDNTNPKKDDRVKYITKAKEHGYTIIGYYFRSSISESITRNETRSGKARIPEAAIVNTSNKLELPTYDEGFDELHYVRIQNNEFIIEDWDDSI